MYLTTLLLRNPWYAYWERTASSSGQTLGRTHSRPCARFSSRLQFSHSPRQPYAYSCGGSSLDSELIPLESGETCVAAIMTAQSDNSERIIAAQKIDNEIGIVREWLLAGKFPACIQDFAPASYELKAYWIGRKSILEQQDHAHS